MKAGVERFELIVMSGSAGGLAAICEILACLPRDLAVPIIVVLHHAPGRSPMVTRILERHGRLPVAEAMDGQCLHAGHVYLAPADRHMQLTHDRSIATSDGRKINFLRSSSDPLMESVVSVYGPHAIMVVLTGTGKNGARGARALHDAGGIVIAQNRATSRQFGMPEAALKAGAVDQVLPLQEIGPAIRALIGGRPQPTQARPA
jgi:two-component system, chemotaxis family, protein-glutamate methylesterase/glutaminase